MSHDKEVYERLARIEEKLEHLDEIPDKIDELDRELSRYRGFVGGILLAVSAIGAFLKLAGSSIKDFFTSITG